MEASREAFEILGVIAAARLRLRRTTVIDATNVQREARQQLLDLARDSDVPATAIVFDLPEDVLLQRSSARADRRVPAHVVTSQQYRARRALRDLPLEGFASVHVLHTVEDVDATTIERRAASPGDSSALGD